MKHRAALLSPLVVALFWASSLIVVGETPNPLEPGPLFSVSPGRLGPSSGGSSGFYDGSERSVVLIYDDGYYGQAAWRDTLALFPKVHATIAFSAATVIGDSGTAQVSDGLGLSEAWQFIDNPQWEIAVTDNIHKVGYILQYDTVTEAGRDSIISIGTVLTTENGELTAFEQGDASDAWIQEIFGVDPVSYVVDGGPMSWAACQIVRNMGYESYRGGPWNGGTGGRNVAYPGEASWDSWRFLDPTTVSPLFGFASFETEQLSAEYESFALDDPRGAIFKAGATVGLDTLQARIDAAFALSSSNGNCPIVLGFHHSPYALQQFRAMYDYIEATYDVAWQTQHEMVTSIKAATSPRAPGGSYPYAQIAIGADTTDYFVGPAEAGAVVATDSLVAYWWETSEADTTGGWNKAATGHSITLLNTAVPTGRPVTTHNGMLLGDYPLAGSPENERQYNVFFNVMSFLAGKEIVDAVIGYKPEYSFDTTDQNKNIGWGGIIGVDNPIFFENWDQNDQGFGYSDIGESIAWTVSLDSFVINLPYRHDATATSIRSFYDSRKMSRVVTAFAVETAGSFVERNVRDQVQYQVDAGLPAVCLGFGGDSLEAGYTLWYCGAMDDSAVANRIYLKVWYAD